MSILKAGRPTKTEKAIAAVQDTQEELIRLSVDMSKEFHKRVKQKAISQDLTLKELIFKALTEYLNK